MPSKKSKKLSAVAAVKDDEGDLKAKTEGDSSDEDEVSRTDFKRLVKAAQRDLGLTAEQLGTLGAVRKIRKKYRTRNYCLLLFRCTFALIGIAILATIVGVYLVATKHSIGKGIVALAGVDPTNEPCAVPAAEGLVDYVRPPVDCNLCKDVQGLTVVEDITPEEFHKNFAFTMKPLLVKGGQKGWNASNVFSMDYFRSIYPKGSEALERVMRDCQFFPYQTKFDTLGEVFDMSKEREQGKGKPWYIGWSNCDGMTANELRKHYKKPTFLPEFYEHARTDWIFMGLPGYGAHMHIDAIDIMSWQAQIKGTKKWTLETPPECYLTCKYRTEIIVEPGDIVVLDTNRWFHSTEIIGNETSIVIGSEFF